MPQPGYGGVGVDQFDSRRGGASVARDVRSAHRILEPRILGLTLLAVVMLLAAACGGGDGEPEVRPFSEVQDGAFRFESDPTDPTRGIFRVTTTEPMICAIVWGEDESFGRLNNSLDMNGTGIIDHDVILPDVEPATEYHYIVQGTTADGTLYRSEPGTFTIEPQEPGETTQPDMELGPSLALDATVIDVSSEFSDGFAAENAFDDDLSTEWSTRDDGDAAFITIDLGEEHEIGAVEFVTRSMADGSAITQQYSVTVDDGDPAGPFTAGTVADRQISELTAVGRQVRIDVESSTGGNVGAVEIRIFGPPR
jgi:hypothetical protein